MESKYQQDISEIKESLKRLEKQVMEMAPNIALAVAKISTLTSTLDNVTRKFAQIPFSQIHQPVLPAIKPIIPNDSSSELDEDELSIGEQNASKKKPASQKPKAIKQDQSIEKVKLMEFLYKKTVNKTGEEYVTMTGKTAQEIEDEVKAFKVKFFSGDAKNKKWSIDLGAKIIEEITGGKEEFPVLNDIFAKKQIVTQN